MNTLSESEWDKLRYEASGDSIQALIRMLEALKKEIAYVYDTILERT